MLAVLPGVTGRRLLPRVRASRVHFSVHAMSGCSSTRDRGGEELCDGDTASELLNTGEPSRSTPRFVHVAVRLVPGPNGCHVLGDVLRTALAVGKRLEVSSRSSASRSTPPHRPRRVLGDRRPDGWLGLQERAWIALR